MNILIFVEKALPIAGNQEEKGMQSLGHLP